MGKIKAGVTLMQDFCRPKSDVFSGYIDYLDREEAQRNNEIQNFNLFNDYMGNPEKSTGLFTNEKDNLTYAEKRQLKDIFKTAQGNGSVMWQTVISFDNRWLEQNGVYDSEKNVLDERKLKEVTRLAVNRLLKSEGLEHAVWSAGIHYNTDNLHVHIATVEPYPMRQKMMYNGEQEVRGKFKLKNINHCKSVVVNEIMGTKDINLQINNIIRKDMVASAESRNFRDDPVIREQFLKLYESLQGIPKHKQNYNNHIMGAFREQIDCISETYIQKYCKEEYQQFTEILQKQSELYAEAYGGGNWDGFEQTKKKDLYSRMGNFVLREIKAYGSAVLKKETMFEHGDGQVLSGREKENPGTDTFVQYKNGVGEGDGLQQMGGNIQKEAAPIRETGRGDIPDPPFAELKKAEMCQKGKRTEVDMETSGVCYRKAAEGFLSKDREQGGDPVAQYRLGRMFYLGKGCEQNLEKAISYLEKSAERKNAPAQLLLSQIYIRHDIREKMPAALGYLTELAEKGDNGNAQYTLGKFLVTDGRSEDLEKGIGYLEKSRGKGNASAKYILGKLYLERGSQVYRPEQGIQYMTELAEAGDGNAQMKLGFEHLKGESVERNIFSAHNYFSQAASQGNQLAQTMAADLSAVRMGSRMGNPLGELDKALMQLNRSFRAEMLQGMKNIREYNMEQEYALDGLHL